MWRLVLTVSLLCCSSEGSVRCRDENNKTVDWFILYKTPKNPKNNKNLDKNLDGLGYLYIDPNTPTAQPNDNNKKINNPNGVLANTLEPLFKFDKNNPPSDFGFISYNDQVPEGYSARVKDPKNTKGGPAPDTYGHSKGVVMVKTNGTDNNGKPTGTGVWLLHSTPKFPNDKNSNNFWPKSGASKAQTFICVTFNYDQFDKIGTHLQRIKAFPFDAHIPPGFHDELKQAAKKGNNIPTNDQFQELKSREGKEFYSIAKNVSPKGKGKPEDGDLYVSISVATEVDSDVFVQTWGGQKGRDKSFCSGKKEVQNIESVKTVLGEWKPGNDHSKWCVADNKPWTCIADVNRAKSQYERPGGALCVEDAGIHSIFKGFIKRPVNCPSPPKKQRVGSPNAG